MEITIGFDETTKLWYIKRHDMRLATTKSSHDLFKIIQGIRIYHWNIMNSGGQAIPCGDHKVINDYNIKQVKEKGEINIRL